MDQTIFDQIEQTARTSGTAAALDALTTHFRKTREWHNLFDTLMLRRKFELRLPINSPTSLQDVPNEYRPELEQTYVAAAREVGEAFLQEGNIPAAWMYLQAIREPAPVKEALESLPDDIEDSQQLEQLVQISLFQGVHPEKGVRLMLAGHGTCSTITALDQILPQLTQSQREQCAKVMVRSLYQDLTENVRGGLQHAGVTVSAESSLRELITKNEQYFREGVYHIDVSHLASVIRFARSIEAPAEELDLALQMTEYGTHLDPTLQYPGEPPFEDFYPSHIQFFSVLLDRERQNGLDYFRNRLRSTDDERDRPLAAFVLVDLLMRSGLKDEAVDVAREHLANLSEDFAASFDELCTEAGRLDILQQVCKERGNLVGFTSAWIRSLNEKTSPRRSK